MVLDLDQIAVERGAALHVLQADAVARCAADSRRAMKSRSRVSAGRISVEIDCGIGGLQPRLVGCGDRRREIAVTRLVEGAASTPSASMASSCSTTLAMTSLGWTTPAARPCAHPRDRCRRRSRTKSSIRVRPFS